MKSQGLLLTGLIAILSGTVSEIAADEEGVPAHRRALLWPLAGQPAVSSNFCEYREGHFHAGLDIRTFGAEGVECIAAGDGHISRLRASPEGYGKAIYLQLDTGETLVYAHLAEFSPELEDVLYEAQRRELSYVVDVRFPRARYPVKRGAVIGYSGGTGGVPPHLHFEIRDDLENPLNPFAHGFALNDTRPPEFLRLQLVPLSKDARIDGRCIPVEFSATRAQEGAYVVSDTVHIDGEVGAAVEVFDRVGARSGKLTPYHITLSVDDSVVSDIRLERFSFTHADQVDFLYDISRVREEKSYFFQLFEMAGEKMYNREFRRGGVLGRAVEEAESSRHSAGAGVRRKATIVATDLAGNTADLVFQYVDGGGGTGTASRNRSNPPGFYFRDGFVNVWSDTVAIRPETALGFSANDHIDIRGIHTAEDLLDGPVAVLLGPAEDDGVVYLMGIKKDVLTSVNFPDVNLQLIVGSRSLYTDLVLYATSWSDDYGAANPGELLPRSGPVRLGPNSITLRNDLEIRFLADRLDSTTAIYRLNERKGEWVFYESTVFREVITTTAKRPGVYAVFADRYGPRIRKPFVRVRASYATGDSRPEIVIPVEDSGSGVDHRRTSVYVTGIEQVAYWDSLSKKLLVVVRDQNIMGPQAVSIVAYDKIGNRSQLNATVDLPHTQQPQGNN